MRKTIVALFLVLSLMLGICPVVSFAESDPPVELNGIAVMHTATRDLETLPIYKELEEKANVHINWTYVRADWPTQKNLLLASGDMPDFFFGRYALSADDIQMNSEYFLPLEDLIEEYAPNVQRMYAEYPGISKLNLFPDGHTYALPHVNPCSSTSYGTVMINETWLKQLNMEAPNNLDELKTVLKAFVENDMNGNGLKDEIGMTFDTFANANFGPRPFLSTFGVHDSFYTWLALGDNDDVIFNPTTEGYKAWIEWLADLNAEGLLDPECFSDDRSSYWSKVRREDGNEIVGMMTGWAVDTFGNKNYTQVLPLEGVNGERVFGGNSDILKFGSGNYNTFSITTSNPDPAATMRWVDLLYSDEYGIQAYYGAYGEGLQENADGTIEQLFGPVFTPDWYWIVGMVDDFVGYVSKEMESKMVFKDEWTLAGKSKIVMDAEIKPYIDQSHNMPYLILSPEDQEEASLIYTDLNSLITSKFAQWVIDGGVEEEWDSYLNELDAAGLKRYLEIYQNAYNLYK